MGAEESGRVVYRGGENYGGVIRCAVVVLFFFTAEAPRRRGKRKDLGLESKARRESLRDLNCVA